MRKTDKAKSGFPLAKHNKILNAIQLSYTTRNQLLYNEEQ